MEKYLFHSHSEADNLGIAKEILRLSAAKNAHIFLLFGDLGAGKTTLTKSFCQILGVKKNVTSPTFALVNEYEGAEKNIYHFDFYRIKSEEEAYDMGYEEYFYSDNYCFIEWGEKIPNLLPENAVRIFIEAVSEMERLIRVETII
jgi:tRNA threonylcarbamoyladenosine biosynthesis protein TsaE